MAQKRLLTAALRHPATQMDLGAKPCKCIMLDKQVLQVHCVKVRSMLLTYVEAFL